MDNLDNLVRAVKDHALEHYTDGGWDVVAETFTDQELKTEIIAGRADTKRKAIRLFETRVSVWADRQADARNSAF